MSAFYVPEYALNAVRPNLREIKTSHAGNNDVHISRIAVCRYTCVSAGVYLAGVRMSANDIRYTYVQCAATLYRVTHTFTSETRFWRRDGNEKDIPEGKRNRISNAVAYLS